ncbi:MAG: GNAT family protein [Candidatus Sulfopaludibacter sp.]|nr:GNAT family protein [Candidatus Sulfopaludibacter sp.]
MTEGIEVRQFELGDAGEVYAAVERNRQYLREWLPWVDQTHGPDQVRDFILRSLAQFHANEGPSAGIWIDGGFAGSIGCHRIDWANRSCSIGYWIDAARQRRGVITHCCDVLLAYLFGELGLHRVVIQCGVGNLRSCAVPQRLGFTREGVARGAEWVNDRWVDLLVWSMLADEWRRAAGG